MTDAKRWLVADELLYEIDPKTNKMKPIEEGGGCFTPQEYVVLSSDYDALIAELAAVKSELDDYKGKYFAGNMVLANINAAREHYRALLIEATDLMDNEQHSAWPDEWHILLEACKSAIGCSDEILL